MTETGYINSSVLKNRLKALIRTDRSTVEIKNKLLPMIESLEETQKSSITADDVMIHLKPYVEENLRLNKQLETCKNRIQQLEQIRHDRETEITRLTEYHKDSGLKRDEAMNCLYVIIDISEGRFAGQHDTRWFCPVCFASTSNWENYCVYCGQKLKREYDDEHERILDAATGRLLPKKT